MDHGLPVDAEIGPREELLTPSLYDDAELYDAIVNPGPCEAFYREEARRTGGAVLELACSTGRLTLPLARDGHAAVGLVASQEMLAVARCKAATAGVVPAFVHGDMRDFELGRRFAIVVVSCNSPAHLHAAEDILACLRRVRCHLVPRGVLAFDVVNPDMGTLAWPADAARRLDAGPNPSSAIEVEELSHYDPVTQLRIARWCVRRPGDDEGTQLHLVLRLFFSQELPFLLGAAGLDLEVRYGDSARNPLTRGSLNQVCLARPASGI